MKQFLKIGVLVTMFSMALSAANSAPLEPGEKVPVVSAVDSENKAFDVTAYLKQGTTLVFFYPKANTGGWTAQACGLQDKIDELAKRGVKVLGVSMDKPANQKSFKDKNKFSYPLIADPEAKVVDAFGVAKINAAMCSRQSFLVKEGTVIWNDLKAGTRGHADDVLKALDKIAEAKETKPASGDEKK